MFKKITKSQTDSWDDIARRTYGTPEKARDISKLNNNVESGEVLVLEESETEADSSETNGEVLFEHGEKKYTDFSEYSLFDKIESIKGATFIFNKTDSDYNFSFNDSVTIYDENGVFLKGRIANIISNLTNEANWFQIEVKSHAGLLAETVMPYPLEFSNVSIKEVLSQVGGYYNQEIEFSDVSELNEVFTNEIGTSFTAQPNETVFNFMKRVCHSRGLILTDTGSGLFVGRFSPDTQEKLNLIDGECLGVEQIRGEFLTVGLARYYELNSQYPQTGTATAQIPFPIPITKRFNSNDYNALDLSTTAERIACMEIGEHFKIRVLMSVNYPIRSGNFAIVKNPKLKINNETDFVIEEVIRQHPDTAILTLTLPCAYTFEVPETLPFCD